MTDLVQLTTFTLLTGLGATIVALPFGVGLAWVLARRDFAGKAIVETLVSLPLVLPPVATGLILLYIFAPRGPLGRLLDAVGLDIVFTWRAVLIAMSIMGLPLLVRTARAGFEHVSVRYEQIAFTLGASPLKTLFTITLPLASRSIIAGSVLSFARALGEFGATITFAGNFPGRTQTLPLAVYSALESRPEAGFLLSLVLLLVSLVVLVGLRRRWLGVA